MPDREEGRHLATTSGLISSRQTLPSPPTLGLKSVQTIPTCLFSTSQRTSQVATGLETEYFELKKTVDFFDYAKKGAPTNSYGGAILGCGINKGRLKTQFTIKCVSGGLLLGACRMDIPVAVHWLEHNNCSGTSDLHPALAHWPLDRPQQQQPRRATRRYHPILSGCSAPQVHAPTAGRGGSSVTNARHYHRHGLGLL